jgi:opacity protein-like surface antigen
MPRASGSRVVRLLPVLVVFALGAAAEDPPAPAASPAPADTAAAPAPAPPPPLELTSFVDAYYGYGFNKVDSQLRNFDVQHNTFAISLVEVAAEKKVTPESRVGFRADIDYGPTADMVAAFEPSETGQDVFKHLQQGYLSVLAGSKLQIDAGKFVTPAGAEVIESKDNWNYSRSLLFALAIPYYHVGVRAAYPVTDKVSLSGYFVNGWNNGSENNSGKTFALGATLKPTAKLTMVANYMTGPEQPDTTDSWRRLFDTTFTFAPTSKLSLMANFDYGRDTLAGTPVTWSGLAAYARLQATKRWAISPRFEWLDDTDGFMTGTPQKLRELTLTSDHRIAGDLVARVEYRYDYSDQPFFAKSGTTVKQKSQSTVTVGLTYAFSGKI